MALIDKDAPTNTNASSQFESVDESQGVDTGTASQSANERVAAAAAANATAAPAEAKTTAVTKAPGAGVAASVMKHNPFAECKNALTVDYNTLTQIMATNGNIVIKDGKASFGESIDFEVISFQDQWVASPGADVNDEEALKYLKFSDNGETDRDGVPLTQHIADAKAAGYEDARIVKRMIVVGAILNGGKMPDKVHSLFQIDLAPRSMANFNRHQAEVAFKLGRNLLDPSIARNVRMTAKLQSKGKMNWTDADFSVAT